MPIHSNNLLCAIATQVESISGILNVLETSLILVMCEKYMLDIDAVDVRCFVYISTS